jgi:hypothetical protein
MYSRSTIQLFNSSTVQQLPQVPTVKQFNSTTVQQVPTCKPTYSSSIIRYTNTINSIRYTNTINSLITKCYQDRLTFSVYSTSRITSVKHDHNRGHGYSNRFIPAGGTTLPSHPSHLFHPLYTTKVCGLSN